MRVEDTYSDDLWEDDFTERPLSLINFAGMAKGLPLFKHSLKLLENISNDPEAYRFSVLQTCIGSGKSVLLDCQLLWHIYLACILKDPHKYFSISRGADIDIGYLAPSKEKTQFLVEPLKNLMNYWDIFVPLYNWEPGKIGYVFDTESGLPEFTSTSGKTTICLKRFSCREDMIGTNLIYITGRNLYRNSSDDEYGYTDDDALYQMINASITRIKAVCTSPIFSGAAFDIPPKDIHSILDKFLIAADKSGYLKVIRLKPHWELFPEKYPDDGSFLFDLRKCCISKIITPDTISIPMRLYQKAQFQAGIFIQDFIGLPVGYCPDSSMDDMYDIRNRMKQAGIEIILVQGKLCLQNTSGDILPLYDN